MPVDTLRGSVRIRLDQDVGGFLYRVADRRASYTLRPGSRTVKAFPAYTASIVEGGFFVTL
jgi:hypothetical protein